MGKQALSVSNIRRRGACQFLAVSNGQTNVKLDYPKTGSQKVGRKQKTRNGYGSNPSYSFGISRVKEVFEFKGIPLRKPGGQEKPRIGGKG